MNFMSYIKDKIENSNETFLLIFKQCTVGKTRKHSQLSQIGVKLSQNESNKFKFELIQNNVGSNTCRGKFL